ncbi:F-box protein [Tanacetum coccineum]
MKTRQGTCYSRTRPQTMSNHKKLKTSQHDLFDTLPDDLVLSILTKLALTASRPADLMSLLLTCKRLNGLGVNSVVLSKASSKCFVVKAKNWSESSLKIRFYCLQNRGGGASCMAKAAIRSHAPALYSLAVIQFNGSGGMKNDKDLRAGVALCARAAFLGHVDAIRELGHCLQDGYGINKNVSVGRRLLIQANARELASILSNDVKERREPHPANKFLFEWFKERKPGPEIRLCSHDGCGRPETRQHEFRRCSVCGDVNYCSRACQALDWKLRHKMVCRPVLEGVELNRNVNEDDANVFTDGFEVYRLMVF